QRPVQGDKFCAANVDPRKIFTQGNALASAAAHLRLVPPRVIDENHAHYLGREGVEMPAVFPCSLLLVQEPQVEFMDQGRGLKYIGISFSAHIGSGYFPEMRVDERHQLFEGGGLAASPFR